MDFRLALILLLASTILAISDDIWNSENADAVAAATETFDRSGLSPDMSEFLDWALENGIDFEVVPHTFCEILLCF